jgi:hypothetical protein
MARQHKRLTRNALFRATPESVTAYPAFDLTLSGKSVHTAQTVPEGRRTLVPRRQASYLGLQVDADADADDRAGTRLVAQELVEVEQALPVKAAGQGGSRIGSPIGWG